MSKRALWQAKTLGRLVEGTLVGQWQQNITGLSNDTRELAMGDLFVALKGARDGHDFVGDALAKGASGAVVSERPKGVGADAPLLFVGDVEQGLRRIGAGGRARSKAKIIAVTGSVGKTSTKDMLHFMLSPTLKTFASKRSFNNHFGVPLTLSALPEDADVAIIELGMNAPNEIAPLARMTCPHIGLITAIAPAHIAAFEGLDAIAREKGALFEAMAPKGCAIFPSQTPHSAILAQCARHADLSVRNFGNKKEDALYIKDISVTHDRQRVQVGGLFSATLSLDAHIGAHFVHNALGALIAVHAVGGDCDKACERLSDWRPDLGRGGMRSIRLKNAPDDAPVMLIDDAYNANPASVRAALEKLVAIPAKRHIAVLGDMYELGEQAGAFHAELADLPVMKKIDHVHVAGTLMAELWQALPAAKRGLNMPDSKALAHAVEEMVQPGDIVLVKGSARSYMAVFIEALDKLAHITRAHNLDRQ